MKKTESGMHEIKNKRRPRAVKNKKEGLHLHAKKRMSRTSKAIVTLFSVLVLVLGVYGIGSAFFKDAERNTVDLNYGSPSVPVAEGEVFSLTGGYAPVDVFARLNWKFSQQSLWYAEMHGTVDTVIQQSITTYKQYENGILISADLTESSLIKSASQFCYLKEKDRVIWRKPASKNYDGLNTDWQTGAPYNIMTIGGEHGFKATNGLPAYELSVYVIAEDTVASTSPVTVTEDGKFKITYDLKPETWQEEVNGVLTTKGATAYYVNQMIFTGGLTTPPEFNAISVTFTFDENWQVFQTDIEEKYSAKYGPIAAPCVSTSTTKYEYNTEKAHSGAYEEYFYQYAEGEVNNGQVEKEITALDCLAEGFGSVLTEPTVLDLDLKIGDTSYRGIVDLDLSKTDFTAFNLSALTAKVKLGPLSLWVEQGNAYLNYGGLKVSLKIDDLIALVKDLTAEQDGGQAEEGDLLSALADGEFTLADGKAELHSVLPLLGLNIPVDFYFTIGENHEIAVEKVTANISVGDSLEIGAQVSFGKEHLPALSASEQAEYVPLMPYVNELIELFSSDVLHADISYKGEGIAVSGGLDLRLSELALAGELQVDVSLDGIELSKKLRLSYTDGMLYLDLDGIKIQASAEEGIALLEQYVTLPDTDALSGFDLGTLVNILLSDDFAAIFSSSEENGLRLAVKGSELLSAFGVDFALGDVTIVVKDGRLSAAALGAEIALTAGTDVALDTQGYTSILPYVQTLIELFSNENLAISVSYTAGDFTAAGEIMLSLASKKAAGEIVLGYASAQKTLSVIYAEDFVYLGVEGVQIKAGVSEAAALISSLTGAENDLDAKTLINKVLALDFGSVISLGEEDDTLTVLIAGTELLHALGVEFELGKVTLSVGSESIKAEAFGAEITVKAGKPFTAETTGYIDIVKYAETVATMIASGYLSADVSYTSGKLAITGKIELALETLQVQGTLTLTYGEASQDINVIYGENVVYLEIGGMKICANINEAVALIGRFIDLPAGDSRERDLIEELLSMDFEQVFELTEEGDTLSLAIAGTELLHALGVEFELGKVTLSVDSESVKAEAFGAEITITQGAPFTLTTDGYIDIVQYANTIATMIASRYLSAEVTYNAGKLSVTGKIELALETLQVRGTLTLTYGEASQDINIIYGAGVVYLEIGGMKISADINEAVALIGKFVDLPANDTEAADLIEELLSMDFEQVFELTEEGDTLSLAIAGTELLHALGVEFELGKVTLSVDSESIKAEAFGAEITITQGAPFTAETAGYIDIVQYAETIATMIANGYLSADVTYSAGKLSVTGKIELALETLQVQGTLTLTYGEASQDINIIYGAGVVYPEIGGMKISADINEAVALIGRFIELPANDTEAADLIEELLSMDFEQVFTLTEEGDTLSLAIAGTELLHALGVEFELGGVEIEIAQTGRIIAKAFGATVEISQGKPFTADTAGYIDIVQYAETVATMIASGYLSADVSYTSGKLSVTGKIELALETLQVQGTLTLTYGTASQDINIIYGEGVVYLEIGGMKICADINEAVGLIGRFIELPSNDTEAADLIEELLSMDFEQVFELTEEGDTLSLAIAGTELLHALGVEFELGKVTLLVDSESIKAEAFGAEVTVKAGKPFTAETAGYIDIVQHANTIATMIASGYLSADVTYSTGKLSVTGKIELALEMLQVQGNLTLTYGAASQDINIIYGENVVYLEIGGMKICANINEAVALIGRFIDLPAGDSRERDLIEELLSMDFEQVFELTEEGDTLSLAIAGTELLSALGVEFELGKVTLSVDRESIKAEAFGAEITVKAGKPFTAETAGYIDIVKYADTIATMIASGYLSVDVSYTSGKLSVTGKIELALETLQVQGTLTLTYGEASQDINIIYGENVVYLEIGGMKISADINEAVGLIGRFIELPTGDSQERDLIEELLSMDFEQVFELTEEGDTLSLAIAGTELLHALGVEFELGKVTLSVDSESIKAEALGAEITVKAGKPFTAETTGYIDIVKYAETIATMIASGYLSADVSYVSGKLAVTGKIELALETLQVQGNLTLTYGAASQDINIIYGENVVYLEIGGMKICANINEAVALIGRFIDLPANDTEATDLIEELLSMDFEQVFELTEEGDTLSLAIAGTELLHALGVEFELGKVTLLVDSESIKAEAFGAEVTVKAGKPFTAETTGYIDIVQYAETVATMIASGYLSADVSYTSGKLAITGKIELALETLQVQGTLTLTYGEASQDINVIYGENVVYLEIGGMKICADINKAVALIGRFVDLPAGESQERDLIEELLSMDFEQVFELTEEGDTLSLAIAGTELLHALGVEFELGGVEIEITQTGRITAKALGATVEISQGTPFTAETAGYIDIVQYANTIATMIASRYLSADVTYSTGKLSVTGKIELALETLQVQGNLTLTYGAASQDINIIYGENVVYLEIGGMKISADINDAIALIGRFVDLPAGDSQERDLIEELLSMDFEQVFELTEEGDTLSLAIAGTELLHALGVEFELGEVTLSVDSESIKAEAFGAEITVKAGTPFTAETTGYIDIVQYANTIATMIASGYLSVDVSYTSGKLSVTGKIELALETLQVQGNLTLTYRAASQDINIIYGENIVYLELGGMKISADVNEAVGLIGRFVDLPAGESQERDLIEELLSMDFEQVFELTEEGDTLSLAIAGTELLHALGVEFELGKVTLLVDSESIKAEAFGAEITITQGKPFTAETTGYIDIVKYAETIATMIASGYLSADVSYTSGKLAITGKIELALETLQVQGTLTLTYGEASQDINIIYGAGVVYLEIGGMKISADINEAVALIGRFIELPAGDSQERDLIEELLSMDFEQVFELTEEGDTLSLAIAGTELLHALGVEFELGKVTLSVDSESIKAEAFGAEITVKAGAPFTADTAGYIDIVKYADTIATMIASGYLSVDVTYNAGNLNISGKIDVAFDLDFKTFTVQANLTLAYGSGEEALIKQLRIGYAGDMLYLTVAGADGSGDLKVSLNVKEAIALVTALMGAKGDLSAETLIDKLLSLEIETIIPAFAEIEKAGDSVLGFALAGTELLNAFGFGDKLGDFSLGNIDVEIGSDYVSAMLFATEDGGYAACLTVKAGAPFSADTEGFFDLTPVIGNVRTMMEDKAISLCGDLVFNIKDFEFEIEIKKGEGILSFADGLKLYLHATIRLQKTTALELYFSYDDAEKTLRFAYGNLGAELVTTDFKDFETALMQVYNKLRSTAAKMFAEGSENPLPEIGSLVELLSLLRGENDSVLGGLAGLDWTEIVKALVFRTGEQDITVGYKGLLAQLFLRTEYGFLGAALHYSDPGKGFFVDGSLYVDNAPRTPAEGTEGGVFVFPQMPETDNGAAIHYLTKQDFIEVIDYLGAAVELLNQTDLTFGFDAAVSSSDPAYASEDPAENGIKYRIKGSAELNFGGEFPVRLDTVQKSLRFSSKAYINLHFELVATLETDTSLYLDIVALDSDLQGKENGYLDFYITVSTVGPGKEGYDPMKVYAPAEELMTVLAGLVDMLGVDVQVVNDYFVTPWLSLLGNTPEQTADLIARLKALGKSLLHQFGIDIELPETGEPAQGAEQTEEGRKEEATLREYIKSFSLQQDETGSSLNLVLRGADLGENRDDLSITLQKTGERGKSVLSKVCAEELTASTDGTAASTRKLFNVTISTEAVQKNWDSSEDAIKQRAEDYFSVQGLDRLVVALAKTATHKANADEAQQKGVKEGEYVRNDQFYIDGELNLNLSALGIQLEAIKIKVEGLAVKFDEKGDISLNARLSYDGVYNVLGGVVGGSVIINGDTVLDLTIKASPRDGEGGMIYLKRTQTTHFNNSKNEALPTPEILYRAFPLSSFMKDYMNHICFMFNLNEKVVERIMGMVGSGGDGGSQTAQPSDIGGTFRRYVKSCTYAPNAEDGLKDLLYTLVLNGAGLTGSSSFGDITVDLGVKDGVLRTINIPTFAIANVVQIDANLTLRNPESVFDAGSSDRTEDIASVLESGMNARLQNVDWSATNYLEGQLGSIKYYVKGKLISEQKIVYDMLTKEFYSALKYPSFEGAEEPGAGYHWEWNKPKELLPNMDIYAVEVPNTYTVMFTSDYDITGGGYTNSEGKYVKTDEYTYNSPYDLHIGTRARGEGFVKELVGFKCAEGHIITDLAQWQHLDSEKALELTAVWEDVSFTVTFDVNGKKTSVTGVFGEELKLPEGYRDAKVGYTFTEWDNEVPATFSEDVENKTFTAQYTPNEYEITFVSAHPIEWEGVAFTKQGEKYVATYMFTYDSKFKLCLNVKAEDGEYVYILTGWTNGATYKDYLPNVLEATTFTAVWEEVGVNVYFGDENGDIFADIEPRNKQVGSQLTAEDLPEVPHRDGYTGEWDISLETYTVPATGGGEDGKIVIKAKYTPITYVIYQYSLYPLVDYETNGFKRVEGDFDSEGVQGSVYYVRKLLYVYGSGQVTLENGKTLAHHAEGLKKDGFDFKGFFSERFGEGAEIENIDDSAIEKIFKWNVGDSENFYEQNTIFAHWKNNAITVRFYSDIETASLNSYTAGKGYYHDAIFLDDKTQIDYTPKSNDGYQLLAWFVQDHSAVGGWKMVTDVLDYRVDDNAATNRDKEYDVELYALWIEQVKLTITSIARSGSDFAATYAISGTSKGGLPHGTFSETIYEAVGVTQTTTGIYILCGNKGNETLKSGRAFTLTKKDDGSNTFEFSDSGMTTAKYGFLSSGASFGGAAVELTFTCGSAKVVVQDVAVVSTATYTVNFKSKDGSSCGSVSNVRINYTGSFDRSFFDNKLTFDGSILSSSRIYADELAASNNIACPQTGEEGRTYIWPHREITGDMDIYPVYVTELQNVTFRSDVKLDNGWSPEYKDGQPTGKYVYKTQLYLEATVTYTDNNGVLRTDTVTGENIFDLPASSDIHSIGNRKGKWGATSFHYDPYGSTFTAEYGEDTVIYYSAIDFNIEYEGTSYTLNADTDYTVTYQSTYTLWTPTRDGYTFLGWFTKGTDGKWYEVKTLELAETAATTKVEALWKIESAEGFITLETTKTVGTSQGIRGPFDSSWKYKTTLSITGDCFIGSMAKEVVLEREISDIKHYVADDNGQNQLEVTKNLAVTEENGTTKYRWEQEWSRLTSFGTNYDRSHSYVVITFTYHLAGMEDITFTMNVDTAILT